MCATSAEVGKWHDPALEQRRILLPVLLVSNSKVLDSFKTWQVVTESDLLGKRLCVFNNTNDAVVSVGEHVTERAGVLSQETGERWEG